MNTKIAYFLNTFVRKSEGFIYDQVIALKRYRPIVFTRDHVNTDIFPYDHVVSLTGVEALTYAFTRRSKIFEDAVREYKIKLIHAHFGVDGVYALPLAKKCGLPLVVTFHGYDITRLPHPLVWPISWVQYGKHINELQEYGSLFIGVSDFISQELIHKGFPEQKVRTHYLGLRIPESQAPVNKRQKIIITAARLVEKKGIEYLVSAMRVVVQKHPDAHLIICGDGPLRSHLASLIDRYQLGSNIVLLGWQSREQVDAHMKTASIFVLPSVTAENGDAEGLGMVFLEAMAHQLPLVGSRSGGIPDVISNGINGFLTEERNSQEIAGRIIDLLDSPEKAHAMGASGYDILKRKFDITNQVAELEKQYDTLLR